MNNLIKFKSKIWSFPDDFKINNNICSYLINSGKKINIYFRNIGNYL